MTKAFLFLFLLCGAAAGYWLYSEGKPPFGPKQQEAQPEDEEKKDKNKKKPSESSPRRNHKTAKTENVNKNKSNASKPVTKQKKSPKTDPQIPKINLTATSFEDPFYNGYWNANDWSFGGKFMSCDTASSATATFRKELIGPSLDFSILRGSNTGLLELRLKSNSNDTSTIIRFTSAGVQVLGERGKQHGEIARQVASLFDTADKMCKVKITATGKRVTVYCNGKRLIRCKQPLEQSGRPLSMTFFAFRGRYNISKLRIEGRD